MALRYYVAIGAVFVILIGGLIVGFFQAYPHGELADKRGWAVLQAMDDPPAPSSGAILLRRNELMVLGFRGVGEPKVRSFGPQPRWSWVLLNEHDVDGEIKQMPEFGSYDLACAELRRVAQAVRDADGYVLKHLRAICT